MSDDREKTFLSRWSQRKAAARKSEAEIDAALPPVETPPEAEEATEAAPLPAIEDLDEQSDYTVFLRKGVPEATRKAALRKLWVTEPSVVNYVPLVEYAWHNNEPGFGPLLPTDNVEQLLKQIFEGTPTKAEEPAEEKPAETAAQEARPALPSPVDEPVVAPNEEVPEEPASVAEAPPRRRHGGALPS